MSKTNIAMQRLICVAFIFSVTLVVVGVMLAPDPSTPSTFASPLSPPRSDWGIHLGNHVLGEPWSNLLLSRIDGDNVGGTWPDTLVVLSRNVYDVTRNTAGDCRITAIAGKHALLTGTGVFTGYLQRAAAAGVRIIIRIWPSPGNLITTTHHLSLSPQPFNGNRCDDGANSQGGNRSYDDVGDEIGKIHQWNVTHGITETGFEPANEPNTEWYKGDPEPTPIQPNNPTAWVEMDAYFTNIYTYVHGLYPASQLRVFTPPMAQNNYAEMTRTGLDRCDPMTLYQSPYSGYEMMPNVFLYGYSNDGYSWHNYWDLGFESLTPNCDPNISPHGHHVDQWFPVTMLEQMYGSGKPAFITEADLESPGSPMYGNVGNKDEQSGSTAANSISQFLNAEPDAYHAAVWNLNITNPNETEQNWHEAYACNDLNWATGTSKGSALERPWFTLWWTGEPSALSFAPCYKIYLSASLKDYPEELIKNGHFDFGSTYWDTSRSHCNSPIVQNFPATTNPVAALGACSNNTDTLSQTLTIPANATSARLSFRYLLLRSLASPHSINCAAGVGDCLFVEVFDVTTGQTHLLASHNDNEPGGVWNSANEFNLLSPVNYAGHTIKVSFRTETDQTYPATFYIDDVSLPVIH